MATGLRQNSRACTLSKVRRFIRESLRLEIYEPQDVDYKAKYVVLWVLESSYVCKLEHNPIPLRRSDNVLIDMPSAMMCLQRP